jgi:TolA-binding protein
MTEGSVRVTGPCVDEPLVAPSTKTFVCSDETTPSASVDSLPQAPVPAPGAEGETAAKLIEKADAARLSGDAANARRLYLRLRERFRRSEEAAKATFLLGRLAESAGSADEAVKWYDAVVRETPRDAYAQEALGRTLALEQGRGNGDRARSLAAEYLRKHPSGPYRAYATSVLESR